MKLFKFLKNHKKVQTTPPPVEVEPKSPALRIIHAGGHVEAYYMAIPAKRILESHLGFILARPDVFRRPWDAVVSPDETLQPGQKFFLVPRRSMRKLRRRIRKPILGFSGDSFLHEKKINDKEDMKKEKSDRKRNVVTWHPSLASITELDTCDNNELIITFESMRR